MFLVPATKRLLQGILQPHKELKAQNHVHQPQQQQQQQHQHQHQQQEQQHQLEAAVASAVSHTTTSSSSSSATGGEKKAFRFLPRGALGRQMAVMVAMSFSCLLDGTVIAYSSPALPSLLQLNSFAVKIDNMALSLIGSVHMLGAVMGCFLSIPAMSLLGRRGSALYPMSLAYLLAYILIATAVNVEMIIIGRVLGGIGMGLTFSITSVYLMDISSPAYRGILGVFPPFLTQVGLLITYVGGIWLDWRRLALLLLSLVLPSVLLFWAIPESPIYLARRGRLAALEVALEALGRGDEKSDPCFAQLRPTSIEKTTSTPSSGGGCPLLPHSLRLKATWQPVLISLALMFFSQATGFTTVLGYTKLIFIESNLGPVSEDDAMGLTAGLILVSCGLAIGLSKVAPRRVLLLSSALGCCLTLTLLGAHYYLKQAATRSSSSSFAWAPLAALLLLVVFYMCGYGAVGWTVIVEILPGAVRGQIFPLVVAFNCVCNFGFALSFRHLEDLAGYHGVFWLHAALTALGAGVIYRWVPETRDRTEMEIAGYFLPAAGDSCGSSSRSTAG